MVVLLAIGVGVCLLASLVPFLFPGALVGAFGVVLNHWLGEFLATTFGVGNGWLVVGTTGGDALTLQGVFVVYLPVLILLLFVLRGR